MTEIFVSCDPASSAPAADSCKRESGTSGEVTELSAANSLFIDFSKLGLGQAGGARWPCAVYMACQECSCSTTIFACFLRRRGGGEGRQLPSGSTAGGSSVTPGLHLAPDAWLLVQGWRRSCPLKPRGERGAGGGLLGNPGHGTSLCPGAITCWHGRRRSFLPAFLRRVSPDVVLPLSPLNNKPIYLFPFSL